LREFKLRRANATSTGWKVNRPLLQTPVQSNVRNRANNPPLCREKQRRRNATLIKAPPIFGRRMPLIAFSQERKRRVVREIKAEVAGL